MCAEIHKLKQRAKFQPSISANPVLNNQPLTMKLSYFIITELVWNL